MGDVFVVGDMDPMCTSHMHWYHMGSSALDFFVPSNDMDHPNGDIEILEKIAFLVDPFQIALTTMPSSWSMEGHLHIQA